MTDTEGTATQADADAQSQADTTSTQTQRDTQAESPDTAALDDLKKVRSEAASLRKRLKDAEAKLADLENAGKSESDQIAAKLTAAEERATAAESRYRVAVGRAAVTDAATKAGAISPKAVYALIRDDIDFDDDGEPTNIGDLIAQAKKDEPQLFRAAAGSADGGKGGPAADAKPNMNRMIADQLFGSRRRG